ncbi:hypothetical protein BIZ37_04335 [Photobacterium sp. BZF1]|uniref:hypothetical protein n=1 Tax=Photobacterium sp. BZF1 TaxID=1904457 RepID=UPI0016537EE1|nr:hypothetical protein [Photobacterium sp. BZF1]MBC7001772.1 hypothetical protein [Photobacterium sp. BZF1]
MTDFEILMTAKAKQLGISIEQLRVAIANRVVAGESEEDPVSLLLSITERDIRLS